MKRDTVTILKKEKETLANITELTPENLQVIKGLFDIGISTRQIYLNLPATVRTEPEIIELCAKHINQGTLKSTLDLIVEQTGMERVAFLKIANKYHPGLVSKYIKRNKVEIERLSEFTEDNPELYKIIASSEAYSQEEKNKFFATSPKWMKKGQPVQYIQLAPNVQFAGRDDYLKLVQAYLAEDSSMVKFCRKYQIDKGDFNKVLDILAGEDKTLSEQIGQVKERASQRYMALMTDFVGKVVDDELSIDEILNAAAGRINGWDFLNSASFTSKEQHHKLLQKMLTEISAGKKDTPTDKIDSQYSLPQIGRSSMEQLSRWFDTGKKQPIEDIYNALGMIHGRVAYIYGDDKRKSFAFVKRAKTYGGDVSDTRILSSFFEDPKTKQRIDITEKNLQDALTIIKANKKVPSHKLAILIIKDIVYGRIPESKITEAYRIVKTKELQEKAKQAERERSMAKLTCVDDYISYINNSTTEQENEHSKEM